MSIGRIEEALRKAKESRQAATGPEARVTQISAVAAQPAPMNHAAEVSAAVPRVAAVSTAMPAVRPAIPAPVAVPAMKFSFADGRTADIPLARLRKNRIITASERHQYADRFQEIHAMFGRRDGDAGAQVIAVMSANPREGRTLGAINLALSLACGATEPVVLADLDFYKPAMHAYFELHPDIGLIDVIENRKALADVLIHAEADRIVLAPAGHRSREHQARLGRENVATIVAALKTRYPKSTLIMDLPPLSMNVDPSIVVSLADHVLVMVEEGKTPREDVPRTLDRLKSARHVIVVLNKAVENSA